MPSAVGTGHDLSQRTILASDATLALAELLDSEREAVAAIREPFLDFDEDDRPVPFQLERFCAALLDLRTGELLGNMVWRPVPQGPTLSDTTWNLGIQLLPSAQGRGIGGPAGLLLARHLFATTGVDRVQALTEVVNTPGWRGLEKVGFRREGVLRGVCSRHGQRRDMLIYGMLRTDLEEADGERVVFGQRDGVLLTRPRPGDEIPTGSGGEFAPDRDRRISPVTPPTVHLATVLDAGSERVLGTASWRAVDHGGTVGCAAWDTDVAVDADAGRRGVDAIAHRLLAEHLFATTELDRVESDTDAENLAGRRALEHAGFRQDGVLRGARVRGGVRRDLALYSLLRTDLEHHH